MIEHDATFYDADGRVIGRTKLKASANERHWYWWLHESHLFFCQTCGKVFGRIEVVPGTGGSSNQTAWHAHRSYCEDHPSKYNEYIEMEVLQWRALNNHLDFYPIELLEKIFLKEFQLFFGESQ